MRLPPRRAGGGTAVPRPVLGAEQLSQPNTVQRTSWLYTQRYNAQNKQREGKKEVSLAENMIT